MESLAGPGLRAAKADVDRHELVARLGVDALGLVARGQLGLAIDGDKLHVPGDLQQAGAVRVLLVVERLLGVQRDRRGDARIAIVHVDHVGGVWLHVGFLGALEVALHLVADVLQVLRLLAIVALLGVLGVARVGRQLEQLRGAHAADEAVLVQAGAGDDVAVRGVQGDGALGGCSCIHDDVP